MADGSTNHFSSQSKTQAAAILGILLEARGAWVPLPEILVCAAQYSARIFELRRQGFLIENRTERQPDGGRHSWFRLVAGNATPLPQHTPAPKEPVPWEDRPRVTGLPLFDLGAAK